MLVVSLTIIRMSTVILTTKNVTTYPHRRIIVKLARLARISRQQKILKNKLV